MTIFESPDQMGVSEARRLLALTEAGQMGTLRIDQLSDGTFKYVNLVTGTKYDFTREGFEAAQTAVGNQGVSEFTVLRGPTIKDVLSGKSVVEREYGVLSDAVRNANRVIDGTSTNEIEIRTRAFEGARAEVLEAVAKKEKFTLERIGFSKQNPLEAVIEIMKELDPTGAEAQLYDEIDDPRVLQKIPGIVNIQKEAAVLLRARVGDVYLEQDELIRFLQVTGGSFIREDKLLKAINVGEDATEGTVGKAYGTLSQKAPKRGKAMTSPRNTVIDTEGVQSLVNYIKYNLVDETKTRRN